MQFIAKIISRIFDFYFWAPILLLVGLFNTGLSTNQIYQLIVILTLLDLIAPLGFFIFLLKTKRISDIDITKREERYILFGAATIALSLSTVAAFFLANHLFFVLHLTAALMTLTLFLTTLRFKISGHLLTNTGAIFLLNFLLGWKLWWLFAVVLFVAFARIYLKKHTLAQVLAGAVVGLAEPILILKLFGLL